MKKNSSKDEYEFEALMTLDYLVFLVQITYYYLITTDKAVNLRSGDEF